MDKYTTQKILNNTDIFENISPNFITFLGLILNFIILYILFYKNVKQKNIFIVFIFIMCLRWLFDNLDGGIARKYNKTSKFGQLFDSLSDDMLFLIFVLYFYNMLKKNKNTKLSIITFIYIIIIIYIILNVCHNIQIIKSNNVNKFCNFIFDNIFIIYIICIIIVYSI